MLVFAGPSGKFRAGSGTWRSRTGGSIGDRFELGPRLFSNRPYMGLGGIAEAAQHLVVGLDFFLAAVELTWRDAFVDEGHGDLLAQGGFGGIAEAAQNFVVGLDFFFAAIELTEPDAFVDEGDGHLLAH